MTDEEFNQYINDKREESQLIYNELISKDEDVRRIFIERMNFESDFISKKGNMIYLNDKKEQLFRYKFDLKKTYQNGLSIRNKYFENKKFNSGNECYMNYDDVLLAKIASVKFEDLYKGFLESEDKEIYRLEYPEFFEYQEYLNISEMNTQRWNKEKINKLVTDKKLLKLAHIKVSDKLKDGFITNVDLKQIYQDIFNELDITIKSKATLIKDNKYIDSKPVRKKINNKTVGGYEISKIIFHL